MKQTFFSILIIVLFTSCVDMWYGIRITNNSKDVIYAYGAYILPDTALAQEKPKLIYIGKHESSHLSGYDIGDEILSRFENEKVTVFY